MFGDFPRSSVREYNPGYTQITLKDFASPETPNLNKYVGIIN